MPKTNEDRISYLETRNKVVSGALNTLKASMDVLRRDIRTSEQRWRDQSCRIDDIQRAIDGLEQGVPLVDSVPPKKRPPIQQDEYDDEEDEVEVKIDDSKPKKKSVQRWTHEEYDVNHATGIYKIALAHTPDDKIAAIKLNLLVKLMDEFQKGEDEITGEGQAGGLDDVERAASTFATGVSDALRREIRNAIQEGEFEIVDEKSEDADE